MIIIRGIVMKRGENSKAIKMILCWLIPTIIIILMVICKPISRDELAQYKEKEDEYYEQQMEYEKFVSMNENYDTDYYELYENYNQLKQEFDSFKASYNENTDLNKTLEDLEYKKQKYLNLIKEYSTKL